jgi:hypothetical protein
MFLFFFSFLYVVSMLCVIHVCRSGFYDIYTGAATGAVRCGSFAGKVFNPFGCSPRMNAVDTMIYMVRIA